MWQGRAKHPNGDDACSGSALCSKQGHKREHSTLAIVLSTRIVTEIYLIEVVIRRVQTIRENRPKAAEGDVLPSAKSRAVFIA
jgi:uncharacterized membrane protein